MTANLKLCMLSGTLATRKVYVGTLLSSLEPAQRFQPRIKRYPQHHTVRGMDSELWRRRHRPIPSVRHVLTSLLCSFASASPWRETG